MSLIGEPDRLMNDIRKVASTPSSEQGNLISIGFTMSLSRERFQRVPKSDILELLEMTTDKDRAWFTENKLSGPDLLELIAEVASILPFVGVLTSKGTIAAHLVNSFIESSATSEQSSGNGADGAPETSPDAESAGYLSLPTSAPSAESVKN